MRTCKTSIFFTNIRKNERLQMLAAWRYDGDVMPTLAGPVSCSTLRAISNPQLIRAFYIPTSYVAIVVKFIFSKVSVMKLIPGYRGGWIDVILIDLSETGVWNLYKAKRQHVFYISHIYIYIYVRVWYLADLGLWLFSLQADPSAH